MSEVFGEAIAPTEVVVAATAHIDAMALAVDTVGTRTAIVAMATARPLLGMVLGTTGDVGPTLTTIDMPAFAAAPEVMRIMARLAFAPAAVSVLVIGAVTRPVVTGDAQWQCGEDPAAGGGRSGIER
jgi:hypothetical protein